MRANDALKKIKDIVYDLSIATAKKGAIFQERMAEYVEESQEVVLSAKHELLEKVIEYKKVEYSHRPEVTLKFESYLETLGESKAIIVPDLFERILSNLLDNSYQALVKTGTIMVSIKEIESFFEIEIIDTGIGIPDSIIGRIGEPGATFGKKQGTGLGIYHAKKNIQKWNGVFLISSKKDFGTRVVLRIKKYEGVQMLVESQKSDQLTTH